MKRIGTLLIGLSLFMVLPMQAAKKKAKKADETMQMQEEMQGDDENMQTCEERPVETSTFLKCFATPQGFFYATIALIATVNGIIKARSAYYNIFGVPAPNLRHNRSHLANHLTEAFIMSYIASLALKDVSTSCT